MIVSLVVAVVEDDIVVALVPLCWSCEWERLNMLPLVCEDAAQLGSYLAVATRGLRSLQIFARFVVCVEEMSGPELDGRSWCHLSASAAVAVPLTSTPLQVAKSYPIAL